MYNFAPAADARKPVEDLPPPFFADVCEDAAVDAVAVVLGELSFVPVAWQAQPDTVQVLASRCVGFWGYVCSSRIILEVYTTRQRERERDRKREIESKRERERDTESEPERKRERERKREYRSM